MATENGVGAHGNESANHFAAIRKDEGEKAYQAAVADFWKRNPTGAKKLGLPQIKAP